MDQKRNQILLGVIILILGIMSLWQDFFALSYLRAVPFILFAASGFSLLLLYRTKRKGWSLCLGCYLVYIGLMTVRLGDFSLSRYLLPAMFFIVPGFIFLVLCFDKNRHGLLIPGFVMFWFGVFLIATRFRFLQTASGAIFLMCMGSAFACARVFGKPPAGKWAAVLGALLLLFSLQQFFNLPFFERILSFIPLLGSLIIIAAAVVIIMRAMKSK